jgi:hypothetical protein
MKLILEHIARKTSEYEKHPLYLYLRDESQPASKRLEFVPSLAHFVMSFADLYALVLRQEPAQDRYQEIVNAHTYEDGGHWKWFLADLKTLGQDSNVRLTDSLRFIWSERTASIRMLTYHMCKLGLGASSLEKLVLVHCIEAGGKVALGSTTPAAVDVARNLGRDLIYFGTHHINTEMQHTLEDAAVHDSLEAIVIDGALRPALLQIVNSAFLAFDEFARGVLSYVAEPETLTSSGRAAT